MSQRDIPHQTQAKDQTPDDFDRDLHPNRGAGVNDSARGANEDQNAVSAYDIKEVHTLLRNFSDDELRRLVIMPPGSRLEQGATYVDLRHMDRGEFKVERPEDVGSYSLNMFVPKTQVDYPVWNKLIGVDNPERLDQADDSSAR